MIPGYTDNVENIRKIAGFIKKYLPTVERYDILAFNNLCSSKYERLDRIWDLAAAEHITRERMELLSNTAKAEGLDMVHLVGDDQAGRRVDCIDVVEKLFSNSTLSIQVRTIPTSRQVILPQRKGGFNPPLPFFSHSEGLASGVLSLT